MTVKYIKEHNNYDLTLNKEYEAINYSAKWYLIDGVLYRKANFESI